MTFDELINAWRLARHPSTSELIDRIGESIRVPLAELPKKKAEATRVWLLAVKSEPSTHLSSRLRQLTVFSANTTSAMVWPLYEAMSKFPADPRIATFACRLLVQDRVMSAKSLRRLFDCVETHGDSSHGQFLDAEMRRNQLGDGLTARVERLIERLRSEPVTTGPEIPAFERKTLLALEWKPADITRTEDPLEAVYAFPNDRARRQVLSDVLLERGDPRGEFIALQLAHASERKQKALIKKYGAQWLGPLADVIDVRDAKPEWRDGFVDEVSVRDVKRNQFLLAADAKEWATVTRVRRGLQRLSPVMRGLRATGPISMDVVEQWARERFVLPSLNAVWLFGDPAEMATVLQKAPRSVPWVTAAIPGYQPTRALRNGLSSLALVPGLERLRLGSFTVDVVPRLIREITLEWFPTTLQVLEFGDEDRQLRLEREPGGWALKLYDAEPPHVSGHWKDLLFGVRGLVPTKLEVHFSSSIGIADTEDFLRRLAEFRVKPEVFYERALPAW